VGAEVHLACFDLTPGVINLIKEGKVKYTIDQQQYLQGYMPIIVLHLYNNYAGMLPGASIPSGPGFVDASNADGVAEQAGVNR
jgi:simple sugar transport system substrate-binding protein